MDDPIELTANLQAAAAKPDKSGKRKCVKNLLVISISFFFLFSPYKAISNLQSSLNAEASIGTISLCVIYISFSLSCVFLPQLFIPKFGYKWSLVICQVCYCVYIIANIYPKWWSLIPAAFVLGIGAGPLWCIQGVIIKELAEEYLPFTKNKIEAVTSRFFGIFSIIHQSHLVAGMLVSSLVLKRKPLDSSTTNITEFNYSNCGVNDCPGVRQGALLEPLDMKTVYLMCGIYIASGICAVVILVIFLDNLKPAKESKSTDYLETVKMLKDMRVWALLPILALSSFQEIFRTTDITKSFVSCFNGIDFIGYWFIFYGVSLSLFSYVAGFISKYSGRSVLLVSAILLSLGINVFVFEWKSFKESYVSLYSLAIVYAICEAIFQNQINVFVGFIFTKNTRAAYSVNRLCQAITGAAGFAYSSYLCVKIKLIIILSTVVIAFVSYLCLEISIRKKKTGLCIEKKENNDSKL